MILASMREVLGSIPRAALSALTEDERTNANIIGRARTAAMRIDATTMLLHSKPQPRQRHILHDKSNVRGINTRS